MKRRLQILLAMLMVTAGLTTPASGFLGFGDIVFDPSNFEQAVRQLVQLERQYAQLAQSYLMLRSQYDHMVRMAQRVPVDMGARYRALSTGWQEFSATNTYGTTAKWVLGMKTGEDVSGAYAGVTESLRIYGSALSNVPTEQLDRLKKTYGSVELVDAANLYALNTVGRLRDHTYAVDLAIDQLEADSLSADPALNTEVGVLNKINAAGLVSIRTAQDTNKLLVALTEQQVLQAKRIRDAEARAINQHIRFMTEGRAVMRAQAAGASQAMLNWRMP
jgi:hypothetical protein